MPKAWSPVSVPITYTIKHIYNAIHHFWYNLLKQPLEDIAEYFGETIAFYFAFVVFYTKWLLWPSIIGSVVFIVQVC